MMSVTYERYIIPSTAHGPPCLNRPFCPSSSLIAILARQTDSKLRRNVFQMTTPKLFTAIHGAWLSRVENVHLIAPNSIIGTVCIENLGTNRFLCVLVAVAAWPQHSTRICGFVRLSVACVHVRSVACQMPCITEQYCLCESIQVLLIRRWRAFGSTEAVRCTFTCTNTPSTRIAFR